MKRIFYSFTISAFILVSITVVFVLGLQYMQGPAGSFRFEGDVKTLSYYESDNVTYVDIKLDNIAVFCEEQKGCDAPQYEGYSVKNVGLNELDLGQHISVTCTVAPVRWELNLFTNRVTCEVVK